MPKRWVLAAIGLVCLCGLVVVGIGTQRSEAAPRNGPNAAARAERPPGPDNLVGHGGPVKSVQISRDGTRALTGSFDYSMMVWDLSATPAKSLARFADHDAAVNVVRFLPGDKTALTAGDDGIVRVWDLAARKLLRSFTGHTAKIVDVAISPDGRWAVSAGWDHTARFWNLETGEAGPVLKEHRGPVNAVAFAPMPDDTSRLGLYSASYDGEVRLFDATTGEFKRTVYRHGWGINCLKALPQPKGLLFGAQNGAVGIIDAVGGEVTTSLASHEGPVLAMTILADKSLAATSGSDGTIRVWDMTGWELREEYNNPYGPVWSLAFSADGERIYYAGLDDFVTMWQVKPREPFEEVASPFPRRFQARQDMSLGEREFVRKCSICHTLRPDDGNRAGPTLHGVFGRKAGSLPGYAYSDALKNSDIIWNEKTIGDLFEYGPGHVTPGTKMPLQKMTDANARDALIAFLKTATAESGAEPRPAPSTKEQ